MTRDLIAEATEHLTMNMTTKATAKTGLSIDIGDGCDKDGNSGDDRCSMKCYDRDDDG